MKGLFITFEGTEGSGKSTQIQRIAERLRRTGRVVRVLREPGGTPIGEEIRHTLQYSRQNHGMTSEAELLLINASRAQLVRDVIRPALANGEVVLCDRYCDSTTAYQGYGRQLNLGHVQEITRFAAGETRPDCTLLLVVPVAVSEARRRGRAGPDRKTYDRMESADRAFFERVEQGYLAIAAAEPERVKEVDATQGLDEVEAAVWRWIEPLLGARPGDETASAVRTSGLPGTASRCCPGSGVAKP